MFCEYKSLTAKRDGFSKSVRTLLPINNLNLFTQPKAPLTKFTEPCELLATTPAALVNWTWIKLSLVSIPIFGTLKDTRFKCDDLVSTGVIIVFCNDWLTGLLVESKPSWK